MNIMISQHLSLFIFLNYSYKPKLKNFTPDFVFCTTIVVDACFYYKQSTRFAAMTLKNP